MTWEETIVHIRSRPEYRELVEQSYLEQDLLRNAGRFHSSGEFAETLRLVKNFAPGAKEVLDIGAGNGISSAAFAREGYTVTAIEPDPSETVGSGAISRLKEELGLGNLSVQNSFGEKLPVENESMDVVYIRQAMHHAADLNSFIRETARVLRPGGVLLTVRDHVILNAKDKQRFLDTHPLQKFYGGENAYRDEEYSNAMQRAGLMLLKRLRFYDSVINYFPFTETDIKNRETNARAQFKLTVRKRFGAWAVNFPFLHLMHLISRIRSGKWTDESRIPGRMYSYIAVKQKPR